MAFSKILNICLEVQYILMVYIKYATFIWWYQQNCNIWLYTTQATSASNVSYMWPWSHKGTMGLGQGCTDEIEKESMGREKDDPPPPKKKHKFGRIFTVLKKFLVNENHGLNTVRSQYRKEHFWCIVCCQPIHSEKKKKEEAKQELVYFWKEQLVHLQEEPRHVPQQRLITRLSTGGKCSLQSCLKAPCGTGHGGGSQGHWWPWLM